MTSFASLIDSAPGNEVASVLPSFVLDIATFATGSIRQEFSTYLRYVQAIPIRRVAEATVPNVELSTSSTWFADENAANESVVKQAEAFIFDESTHVGGLLSLARRIQSFVTSTCLEDEDAQTLAQSAAKDALTFIQTIPLDVALPLATCADDGEIVLLWAGNVRRAEVRFSGAGEVGYALLQSQRFMPGAERAESTVFPADLRTYLNQ